MNKNKVWKRKIINNNLQRKEEERMKLEMKKILTTVTQQNPIKSTEKINPKPNPSKEIKSPTKEKKLKQNDEEKKKINADTLREKGNEKFQKEEINLAIEYYHKAMQLCPNDARIQANLVNCHVKNKQYENAIKMSISIISDETLEEQNENVIKGMIKKNFKMCRKTESIWFNQKLFGYSSKLFR